MGYKLLPKQIEFMKVPHNEMLDVCIYQSGFGGGKTFAGALLGINLCEKYAGCRGLVGAATFTLVERTTLVKYFEHLEAMGYKKGKDYRYNETKHLLSFKNGSEIYFMDLADPEKFKSMDVHWIEIEEASQVGYSTIKGLLGRLRNTKRGKKWGDFRYRLFGHTNPEPNKGWIWERFVENKQPNWRLVQTSTQSNTYLPEHFVKELESSYDPEYYRINVLGEFGDYNSGLVVKGFTDANIKQLKYCEQFPIHLSCDFNVDPMMWVIAHKDEHNVYFFDEIVVENTTTEACIKEFIRRYPKRDAEIIINGDASGDNRSTQSNYTNYAIMRNILAENGYKNIKFELRRKNPIIEKRIAAFNSRVCNSKGQVRLFVDKKCKWLLYNIRNLKYKEGSSIIDTPTIHKIEQDRDKKFLMHIFDAASYLTEYYWAVKVDYSDKK